MKNEDDDDEDDDDDDALVLLKIYSCLDDGFFNTLLFFFLKNKRTMSTEYNKHLQPTNSPETILVSMAELLERLVARRARVLIRMCLSTTTTAMMMMMMMFWLQIITMLLSDLCAKMCANMHAFKARNRYDAFSVSSSRLCYDANNRVS